MQTLVTAIAETEESAVSATVQHDCHYPSGDLLSTALDLCGKQRRAHRCRRRCPQIRLKMKTGPCVRPLSDHTVACVTSQRGPREPHFECFARDHASRRACSRELEYPAKGLMMWGSVAGCAATRPRKFGAYWSCLCEKLTVSPFSIIYNKILWAP
jgi:hypothetical protein